MAVPANRRSESKFEVLLQTRSLAVYTATITANEKVFPPQHKWMADKLNNTAHDIFMLCWEANGLLLSDLKQRERRKQLQKYAIVQCNNLSAEIYLAHTLYHLRGQRVYYWQDKIDSAKTLIQKWIESDSKR